MRKRGIRYLRFSKDKQSMHSLERQDTVTGHWMTYTDVEIVDTFTDSGHSARNFDRPDITNLFAFIKKNYKHIDFLVVSELTRFSRDVGDAINMVKKIQFEYDIRIVSAGRGAIYDVMDSNSYFMMGLEFLLGESENIKRASDIRGGIYAAKAVKLRYVSAKPPYGYIKVGDVGKKDLVSVENDLLIVEYIFEAFLKRTPIVDIEAAARKLGFKQTSSMAIQEILSNPTYCGYQYVKEWKNNPGGWYKIENIDRTIIDFDTYQKVQTMLKREEKERVSLSEEIPLRGVLRCHCGRLLTGAPSRGRHGKYYYYYKCHESKHNNISAIKAHEQIESVLALMSIPAKVIEKIKRKATVVYAERSNAAKMIMTQKKQELSKTVEKIKSLEEKFISDNVTVETYTTWMAELKTDELTLKSQLESLGQNEELEKQVIEENLFHLSDLRTIFKKCNTAQKQEFLRAGFDGELYYREGAYRTPSVSKLLMYNEVTLSAQSLLFVDKTKKPDQKIRSCGG